MQNISPALRIALIYFIISVVWIFTSDSIVANITTSTETLNFLQTAKGWFFVTATSILIFILANKYIKAEHILQENLRNKSKELRNTIENSPTPACVLREDGKFLLINKIWLELSGYEYEEIDTLEKWTQKAYPNNAKAVEQEILKLFDKEDIDDNGEFNLKTKSGEEIVWHFYSSILGLRDGKRTLIATAIDVTELNEKNRLIIQQSKMAALGEMIENIAHQWRQPLSTISTISTGIELQEQLGKVKKGELLSFMHTINENTQYLSNTINDFRGFFDKEKEQKQFYIDKTLLKAIEIVKARIKNHHITVIDNIDTELSVKGFENEFIQVIINILNNAIDVLKEKEDHRVIYIKAHIKKENVVILIKDSGGGIKEENLDKIFEPYFTTKHKSQGTGIGLFMSEEIIRKHMSGSLLAKNSSFEYEDETLEGAEFKITIPMLGEQVYHI